VLLNTTITPGASDSITGCATVQFVCPEGSLVQINNKYELQYDLMEHTFVCGTTGYGLDYDAFDDNPLNSGYILDITSIQCFTICK
jgi:hypothetical protein